VLSLTFPRSMGFNSGEFKGHIHFFDSEIQTAVSHPVLSYFLECLFVRKFLSHTKITKRQHCRALMIT